MSILSSVIFRRFDSKTCKTIYTIQAAAKYLKKNHLHPIRPLLLTAKFARYRITDPKIFRLFYIIDHQNGIYSVMGQI